MPIRYAVFGDELIGQTAAILAPTVGRFCLVAWVLQIDRDVRFHDINRQGKAFAVSVSADTKKKELVGNPEEHQERISQEN